ncbi:MAG: DUF3100 domain-containing protein [Synergistaceae bacterium]|jgi:hypothetical protein|nr:DUF3100 domain-containing protein [Synergistaceae bacterium]
MEDSLRALKNVKVHVLALILTVVCEFLGTKIIPMPIGSLVFFPMLYALILGFIIGLPVFKTLKLSDQEDASYLINISVMLLIARYGTLVGPNFFKILQSGLALVLQEFGNLGTAFLAIPIAVFLGLRRESIGAGHSIGREGNLALISEVYGLDSPEGRGVMGVYICGTVFGSIFFGLMASLVASWNVFSVESLAMAAGTGSASMMTATVGALQTLYPDKKDIILAYGAASNMLTSLDGLYMSLFMGLPISNWLYKVCYRVKYGVNSEQSKLN